MNNEVELISDGDGVAILGDPAVIDRFLSSQGLASRDLGLKRLGPKLSAGSGALHAGSEFAANSGRWVKLTEDSARALKAGQLMRGSTADVGRAVLVQNGQTTKILEIVRSATLLNPASLASAGALMSQLAMQQTMDDIADYLATIDEKVEDVLRAQKDSVLADMIGVDLVIDEAMVIREQVGKVSEVTWSKVQSTSVTIARTQAYALRQLDAIAEKLERKTKLGDLAKATREAEAKVQEWLTILARCFQLQEAIGVLELDRVLDAFPEDLDQHRIALKAARQKRLDVISRSTERLISRMNTAAGAANRKVLLQPVPARAVVHSSNHVSVAVIDFHYRLGIEGDQRSMEAKRWVEAAAEVRDNVLETGAEGVDAAKRFGHDTLDRAKTATDRLSSEFAERARRRRGDDEEADAESS
ncbi:hypothetical protein [Occultella gossypii]|uniref:Uncharacterized protein n=1 Tax=Occultella gossypii TaxID=2800820 RepID=A0ABS7S6Q4_9MICO|nr:hypothetical protein [Occultella gossypii]MBZ2195415.1 hypothetical protein [Occultella gossypii]